MCRNNLLSAMEFFAAKQTVSLLLLLLLTRWVPNAESVGKYPALGVNYGQMADNLPSPSAVAGLVQKTSFSKVRIYGADPALIKAFANTGAELIVNVGNGLIPSLAQPASANDFVKNQIAPFVPASNIIAILVGNEVIFTKDNNLISQLVPALQNLHSALAALSLDQKIKVSTPHSLAILSNSVPPSAGRFQPEYESTVMKPLLDFLSQTGAPLMVNPYPYFAYKDDPTANTLAYALFQSTAGITDANTGLHYSNMFDAMIDAVYSAMKSMGYTDVEIVAAETGWPSQGASDEPGATPQNAAAYNGNLIKHVTANAGTPLLPNRNIETYIFSLFNENQKPGPLSEHYFGLFNVDMTPAYDVQILQTSNATPTPSTPTPSTPTPSTPTPSTPTPASPKSPSTGVVWCVAKPGADSQALLNSLNYACAQGINCGPIQLGGPCYDPNTVQSHASYAMNEYYQTAGRNSWNCDFSGTGTITTKDPSYGGCKYPGP